MTDLSVITVTYSSKPFIEDQVMSVLTSSGSLNYEQWIVDNHSKDGTADWIEERLLPYVHLIKNGENRGFSFANNQAVSRSFGRYFLFLNPDMRICEGSLDQLVSWMDAHPEAGLMGCKLLNEAGELYGHGQPKPFPSFLKEFLWLLRLDFLYPQKQKFFDSEQEQEVDMVRGAFMLVRREVVEALGWGFDPRYFILFEDTDLCREVKRLRYKVVYSPKMTCIDLNSRSFALCSGKWIYKEFSKSMLQYFQKWHPFYQGILIALAIPIGLLLRTPQWGWRSFFKKS